MKTKILFFLPNLNGGGAERVSVNIMKKLDKNDFDIHLVLVKNMGEYLELIPSYINIHDLNFNATMYSIVTLRKKIKKINPDIIYSTLYRTHIALYIALLGILNKPKIILRMPNSPKLVLERKQISFLSKFLLDRALFKSNLVIAQTPEMKDEISKFHYIAQDKIHVLINPLDTKYIDMQICNINNPFDTKYINVIAAGRLMYQKGYDILIESFKNVYVNNNNYRLFIIGADYDNKQKEFVARVKELNLEGVISFLGFQKNPYQYYFYSDLFVLSSRWEGLPNTVLENMYLNKPIVATKCIPFMNELIRDGENGLLVNVENIEELSNAILNFKSIQPEYRDDSTDINKFFLNLKRRT